MTAWWWSWVLAGIGVGGLYLVTRKDWRGYVVGLGVQVLWVLYAVLTVQWGFIASAIAYGTVNALGLYRWRFAKPKPIRFPVADPAASVIPVVLLSPGQACWACTDGWAHDHQVRTR